MFERFSDGARKTMALANRAADRLNHQFIGSEHILLGIVDNDADAATAILKKLGVNPRTIRKEVEERFKSGPEIDTGERLPQTPFAKSIIENAIYEARALGCRQVDTEHLLLGILCVKECKAAQVLVSMGIDPDVVRKEVTELPRDAVPAPDRTRDSAAFKLALGKAFEEAQRLGHRRMQPEHLLLGLLSEPEGITAKALTKLGVTADQLRQEVLRLMDEQAGSGTEPPSV